MGLTVNWSRGINTSTATEVHPENEHYVGVLEELVLEKAFTGHFIVVHICSAITSVGGFGWE